MTTAQIASFALATALAVSFTKFWSYYIKDQNLQNQVVRIYVFVVAFIACVLFDPALHGAITLTGAKQALLDSFQVGFIAIGAYHALIGLPTTIIPAIGSALVRTDNKTSTLDTSGTLNAAQDTPAE